MIYILLSIICNIVVSILLKLARRYEISVPQAIVWNYAVASLLTYAFYKPSFTTINWASAPIAVFILLAILLPSLFIILGLSVRYTGIVRTDLAQRLSLFIPLLFTFLILNEPVSILKSVGISIGFIAILCTIPWHKTPLKNKGAVLNWLYPLLVFVGMGIIDLFFKQIAAFTQLQYTTSLFIIFLFAFAIAVLVLIIAILSGKTKFRIINLFCGIILGVFNFGNILFYLKAHRDLPNNPSVVFSAMNIGVIIAGALIGVYLFKEKLSKINRIGIFLAILAIFILYLAK
ncbi:hypothetical protein ADIARSV_0323 [Arcticibacter svalbardensis MN12-7]|uniref:EamA domain-containing protein n=1 Tax=Arcticibacter svalbardensis MN12-7 TaxID=1150600 RepID=R9GY31_9SPHI|nr:DMT family transporter [Arcticibacter svalbardensis]EOR96420.1 hypothetical protein ADIARSV_0323 [Arcticibacter svalbardensis MN12-7]